LRFAGKKRNGYIHGISPVDPVTISKPIETFRVCRTFCADHFGYKFFRVRVYFQNDMGQILLMHFRLFLRYFALFCTKEKPHVHRTIDESASFFVQIIKPMAYSGGAKPPGIFLKVLQRIGHLS
jgi:hypothetical protein